MTETTYPNIIILGKAGAGKTTVAQMLNGLARFTPISFAAPLKDMAADLWGEDARMDRDKLQKLGIAVREIDCDAWSNLLFRRIERLTTDRPSLRLCVDDCRFPNELAGLIDRGWITVRVSSDFGERETRLQKIGKLTDRAQLEHESETRLDSFVPMFSISNNGDREDLRKRVVRILDKVAE